VNVAAVQGPRDVMTQSLTSDDDDDVTAMSRPIKRHRLAVESDSE